MNYTDFMTHNEAVILAAVLVDGGKDEELMHFMHRDALRSEAAKCVTWAIQVLDSKDLDIDVISVHEYIRDSDVCKSEYPHAQPVLTIAAMNSITQALSSKTETMAAMARFLPAQGEEE